MVDRADKADRADARRQTREDATGKTRDRVRAQAEDQQDQDANQAQLQSDAPTDASSARDALETSDRADGRGSSANGTPAFDEAEGAERRRLYKEGAEIVSRID